MTHPDVIEHARQLLTPAQFAAWQLELDGHGHRRIGLLLDIGRGSVRDRLDGAYRALKRHGIWQDASGNWHTGGPVRPQEATRRARSTNQGNHPNPPVETVETLTTRKDAA